MNLEECRKQMSEEREEVIEDTALRLADLAYPGVPIDFAMEITRPIARNLLDNVLSEETKLFLQPTTGPTC